jgi:phosphoenolpyruvate carboxykinase (GTP)
VLKWIADRIEGRASATDTPIGFVPTPSSLTLDGMNISRESLDELLSVNSSDWAQETEATAKFFEIFGDRLPQEITNQQKALSDRLARTTVAAK